MPDLLRQEIAAAAELLVVKVGTRVLTQPDGTLDEPRMAALAAELCSLADAGRRVVLVSSGAVGAGLSRLGIAERPVDLARLQAVAAVGQTRLVECYDRTFRQHGRFAAQVLLTCGDLDDRARYLNVRNTLWSLMDFQAVPIINENDTVAVEELRATFGDNDRLAALVTNLLRAPLLLVLSDVEGLYDRDPQDADAALVSTVTDIDASILAMARDRNGGAGRGGMRSKLEAARIVTAAGENMVIAGGRRPGVISEVLAGEPVGTLFLAQGKSVSPWKRWIGFSAQPRGKVLVDAGAAQALAAGGKSLLAIGIRRVEGEFAKGDVVSICREDGAEFARGLSNYEAAEVRRIQGRRSDEFVGILGQLTYTEVVHRDNLALV